jgi:hypothetical protein
VRRRRVLAFLAISTAVPACSLLIPFEEYDRASSGANPDGAASDGATDDGRAFSDARLCRDPHWVCDDFDQGDSGYWTASAAVEGGVLELSTSVSTSPPRSLRLASPSNDAGAVAMAYLEKEGAGAPVRSFDCAFDVRVASSGARFTPVFVHLMLRVLGAASPRYQFDFTVPTVLAPDGGPTTGDPRSYFIESIVWADGGFTKTNRYLEPLVPERWHHVRIAHDGRTLTTKIDDSVASTAVALVDLGSMAFPGIKLTLIAGVSGWEVNLDDVICDLR